MKVDRLQDKIEKIKSVSSDVDYLRGEFNGKLFATRDGHVDIVSMLDFAMEYDYLLEHIIQVSKKIKELSK